VGVADTATVAPGSAVVIDVLANDSDPEDGPIRVDGMTQPGQGGVVMGPNGTILYIAGIDIEGTDTFTYWVADNAGNFTQTDVSVALNGPPTQKGAAALNIFVPRPERSRQIEHVPEPRLTGARTKKETAKAVPFEQVAKRKAHSALPAPVVPKKSEARIIAVNAPLSQAHGGRLEASSLDANIVFVGHSLVNHDLPAILRGFMKQNGGRGSIKEHIINGAPLWWNWENAADAEPEGFGVNAREELALGGTDVLVMTEGVPIIPNPRGIEAAANFFNLAVSSKPDARVFLYETWHDLQSGAPGYDVDYDPEDHIPWRERIDHALPYWLTIVDAVNAQKAPHASHMELIPAGQVMGRMYDEIEAGNAPGLTDIGDLFIDGIHLNPLGLYLVALVHYTTIYGKAPELIALRQYDQWGRPYTMVPTREQALFMKRIVWEEVTKIYDLDPDGAP
jgi:hypothetical protein